MPEAEGQGACPACPDVLRQGVLCGVRAEILHCRGECPSRRLIGAQKKVSSMIVEMSELKSGLHDVTVHEFRIPNSKFRFSISMVRARRNELELRMNV